MFSERLFIWRRIWNEPECLTPGEKVGQILGYMYLLHILTVSLLRRKALLWVCVTTRIFRCDVTLRAKGSSLGLELEDLDTVVGCGFSLSLHSCKYKIGAVIVTPSVLAGWL